MKTIQHSDQLSGRIHKLNVTGNAFAVLHAIARRINVKTRFCFPSQSTLAADCGVSVRTVYQHIKGLEKAGLIVVEKRSKAAISGAVGHYVGGGINLVNVYSFTIKALSVMGLTWGKLKAAAKKTAQGIKKAAQKAPKAAHKIMQGVVNTITASNAQKPAEIHSEALPMIVQMLQRKPVDKLTATDRATLEQYGVIA